MSIVLLLRNPAINQHEERSTIQWENGQMIWRGKIKKLKTQMVNKHETTPCLTGRQGKEYNLKQE